VSASLASRRARRAAVALAALGLGLIAAPAIFQMFDRAPKGATMIKQFRPYMQPARLAGYQREIRQIDEGVKEADTKVAAVLGGPGAAGHRRFEKRFPDFAGFPQQWEPIRADMTDMLSTIQANVPNYRAVAALPSFTLFPWFFVIPGLLILGALGAGLRGASWGVVRRVLTAIGIGLVLAPAVFQMFGRAPKGARMVKAFKPIETRHKVETIQGYFATIAVGQGAVRLNLVPALRKSGLTTQQIEQRYPHVVTLDRRWIPILGDFTPMIGTMSDNVVNYDAVKALPSFKLFPWFFVIPGLLIAGLAFLRLPRTGRPAGAAAAGRSAAAPEHVSDPTTT
jgi:hypothetical protein